jgi:uncharacterized protein (DUF1330 family)
MSRAYAIFLENVDDQVRFAEYRRLVVETLVPFGGSFVVRGGQFTRFEGDWPYERCVVIEFPSRQKAEDWYNSQEYQEILPLRLSSMKSNAIIIEGVPREGEDKLDPVARGLLEELRISHPHLLDLVAVREGTDIMQAYVEVVIPAPAGGPFKKGLWIQTLNDELTVGFGDFHKHFNEWNIGNEQKIDAARSIFEVALSFVDSVLSEEVVQVAVVKGERYFASWLEPSERLHDIVAGRAPWMSYKQMMGASFEFDQDAPYTVVVRSWKGTINASLET